MVKVEKYKIDIENIHQEKISRLKQVQKAGYKHLDYYHNSMSVFEFPERRVKCYDTIWFEEVLPIVTKILKSHG